MFLICFGFFFFAFIISFFPSHMLLPNLVSPTYYYYLEKLNVVENLVLTYIQFSPF